VLCLVVLEQPLVYHEKQPSIILYNYLTLTFYPSIYQNRKDSDFTYHTLPHNFHLEFNRQTQEIDRFLIYNFEIMICVQSKILIFISKNQKLKTFKICHCVWGGFPSFFLDDINFVIPKLIEFLSTQYKYHWCDIHISALFTFQIVSQNFTLGNIFFCDPKNSFFSDFGIFLKVYKFLLKISSYVYEFLSFHL